jgi:hypothetical protein
MRHDWVAAPSKSHAPSADPQRLGGGSAKIGVFLMMTMARERPDIGIQQISF